MEAVTVKLAPFPSATEKQTPEHDNVPLLTFLAD